ncbi:MAG: 2-phosphosulfolactate phosphatase [Armatimonadetes bacterium]|nr:2-phosphosulfolactate phosphatase [Armatimonadota bacterium]MDW8122208.1 2-phosphosulfolactate phosphatase [Armatimonadota bacterium]
MRQVTIGIGERATALAVHQQAVTIVIDALRASSTLSLLFHKGAFEVLAFPELKDLFEEKERHPQCLLVGERGALKVPGFDYSNSPTEIERASDEDIKGKRVLFTSTTGVRRLLAVSSCPAVLVGCPANASSVCHLAVMRAKELKKPLVIVACGVWGKGAEWALEDVAAAWFLADRIGADHVIGPDRPQGDLLTLFLSSPHGQTLRQLGLEEDILWCAQVDTIGVVPEVIGATPTYVRLAKAVNG